MGLAGILGTKEPEGVWRHQGAPKGCMECVWQCQGVYGVLGVYWDASNDSRYSGTRKHIGASGDSKGMQGYRKSVWGCQGVSWCVVDVKGVLGLAGTLGTQGPVGV